MRAGPRKNEYSAKTTIDAVKIIMLPLTPKLERAITSRFVAATRKDAEHHESEARVRGEGLGRDTRTQERDEARTAQRRREQSQCWIFSSWFP